MRTAELRLADEFVALAEVSYSPRTVCGLRARGLRGINKRSPAVTSFEPFSSKTFASFASAPNSPAELSAFLNIVLLGPVGGTLAASLGLVGPGGLSVRDGRGRGGASMTVVVVSCSPGPSLSCSRVLKAARNCRWSMSRWLSGNVLAEAVGASSTGRGALGARPFEESPWSGSSSAVVGQGL